MLTLWAVLRREVDERRQVLWLGLFLGVLCPLVAYLPLGFRARPSDVRDVLVLGVTIAFFGLVSLLVGLGLFASDQAAGRAGFYLSRPVRPWHLLVGRLVAALGVVMLGSSLVLLPTLAVSGKLWRGLDGGALLVVGWLTILLLSVSHAAAVALRLRGRWTLLDLGALAATFLLAGSTLRLSRDEGLYGESYALPAFLGLAVVVAAVAGVWVQLRFGGTRRIRLHAVFSVTFWVVVLVSTIIYDGRIRSELGKTWDDVETFSEVIPSSDGGAVWLTSGQGTSIPLSFVLDLRKGVLLPVDTKFWPWPGPTLAGRTVVWPDCERSVPDVDTDRVEGCPLRILDLDADPPTPRDLGRLGRPLLDPKGERLAYLGPGRLTVLAVRSLRPIFQIDNAGSARLIRFQRDGSLLLFAFDQTPALIHVAVDGSTRSVPVRGSVWPASSGDRLVESTEDDRWIIDTGGRRLREVPTRAIRDSQTRYLSEDWMVWTSNRGRLLFRSGPTGEVLAPIELPHPADPDAEDDSGSQDIRRVRTRFGLEAEPGRLLVSVGEIGVRRGRTSFWRLFGLGSSRQPSWWIDAPWRRYSYDRIDRWSTHYVDLQTGDFLATFEGFAAVQGPRETSAGPEAWLLDERGLPHRFDPSRLDPGSPLSSLEPIFAPPWDDGNGSDESP